EMEEFGGETWTIRTVPQLLEGADPKDLVLSVLENMVRFGSEDLNRLLAPLCALAIPLVKEFDSSLFDAFEELSLSMEDLTSAVEFESASGTQRDDIGLKLTWTQLRRWLK
ncbi:MAG: hypothetical protein V1754_14210, partial [Pseudomonadota bacterium]